MFPGNLLSPTPMYQGVFRPPTGHGPSIFESLQAAARERNQALNQVLAMNGPFLTRPLMQNGLGAPLLVPMGMTQRMRQTSKDDSPTRTSPPVLSPHERGFLLDERRPKSISPRPRSPPSSRTTTSTPKLKFGINSILSSDISPKKEQPGEHFYFLFIILITC